jgi:hypothetical protein
MLTRVYSGVTRSLRAIARPATSALRPQIARNFAPALGSRFASTDQKKVGKIHQVIGAVVDGMLPPESFS